MVSGSSYLHFQSGTTGAQQSLHLAVQRPAGLRGRLAFCFASRKTKTARRRTERSPARIYSANGFSRKSQDYKTLALHRKQKKPGAGPHRGLLETDSQGVESRTPILTTHGARISGLVKYAGNCTTSESHPPFPTAHKKRAPASIGRLIGQIPRPNACRTHSAVDRARVELAPASEEAEEKFHLRCCVYTTGPKR